MSRERGDKSQVDCAALLVEAVGKLDHQVVELVMCRRASRPAMFSGRLFGDRRWGRIHYGLVEVDRGVDRAIRVLDIVAATALPMVAGRCVAVVGRQASNKSNKAS